MVVRLDAFVQTAVSMKLNKATFRQFLVARALGRHSPSQLPAACTQMWRLALLGSWQIGQTNLDKSGKHAFIECSLSVHLVEQSSTICILEISSWPRWDAAGIIGIWLLITSWQSHHRCKGTTHQKIWDYLGIFPNIGVGGSPQSQKFCYKKSP